MGEGSLAELWIASMAEDQARRVFAVRPAGGAVTAGETLQNVTWAPDGAHLLLTTRQASTGDVPRTRLLWLPVPPGGEPDGEAVELVTLPSEVISHSGVWSPDGRSVAFLARTGRLLSLCVLALSATGPVDATWTADDGYRYVADLGPAPPAQQPLPWAPPLARSPDGIRLAYAAPASAAGVVGAPAAIASSSRWRSAFPRCTTLLWEEPSRRIAARGWCCAPPDRRGAPGRLAPGPPRPQPLPAERPVVCRLRYAVLAQAP